MLARRRKRRTKPSPLRPRLPLGGLVIAVIAYGLAYKLLRTFGYAWIFETLSQPDAAGYVLALCIPIGGLIVFAFNFRRPIAKSRLRGGKGLRLGQGPLPDHTAFRARIERLAGTPLGDLLAIGYWLLFGFALVINAAMLPIIMLGYVILFSLSLIMVLTPLLDWVALVLLIPCIILVANALMYCRPRVFAVSHLLIQHSRDRWSYAVERLTRGAFQQTNAGGESGHDPAETRRARRRSLLLRSD